MGQTYVIITFEASEIPAFAGAVMVDITWLVHGGRKTKLIVPYTSFLVTHTDTEFVENKFVLLGECVVNRWWFCIL
jgi:hypothetical protein